MSKRYVIRSTLVSALLVSVLIDPGSQAMAQASCTDELSNADQAYNFGRFDEAITLLNRCLKKRGVVRIEQQRSHRLLALSYIGKNEPSRARESVRDLVVTQPPVYQPDPVQDPPPFVQMVEEVQREMQEGVLSSDEAGPDLGEEQDEGAALDALVEQAQALYEAEAYRDALPLFQKAADQGHADAQYGLGLLYREGRALPQLDKEAMTWFRKAADQGHADAQFYVGWLYWKGQGAEQSDEEAVKWYRKAAAQGHERAQRVLNRMTGG